MTRTGAMRSTRVATSFTPADDGRLVAQTWLGSRTILFIVAVVGMTGYHRTFSQVTGNWDVQHFMSIARNGYADPLEMAFFPGLPALLKVGSLIGLPMEVTGVLLGLVGSALAAWALFRIGGTVPACLWLIAPTAVFTVVGYTESPFCAAAFWSWERARAGKWWPAALLAGLACTFRVSGLFLVGALAVMAVLGDGDQRRPTSQAARRRRNTEIVNRLSTLLVPAAVLVAFAVWLHRLTGSWTAWSQAQTKPRDLGSHLRVRGSRSGDRVSARAGLGRPGYPRLHLLPDPSPLGLGSMGWYPSRGLLDRLLVHER